MDMRESIINQNDFTLGLTKQLLQTEGKQLNLSNSIDHLNSFAAELVSVIFSDGSPSGGPQLSFANANDGWVDKRLPLKPYFKQLVETSYMAALAQVLPPRSIDCSTTLIFANALYFKGARTEKFDAS
ncbi:hypothetical protein ACFX13_019037 [Malus domestica]